MAKTVGQIGDNGKVTVAKVTKKMSKSEQALIGWTPGPQTAWQKFKRAAVG